MPAPPPLHAPPVPTPFAAILVVTPCPWTGRTLDVTLAGAGFSPLRVPDVDLATEVCATGVVDAVVVDERAVSIGTTLNRMSARRILDSATAIPVLPALLLARETVSSATRDAAYETGFWGVASFPFGGASWLRQLGVWVAAGREARRRTEAGLVDAATGLYNARGLDVRAQEVDAAVRRTGGPLACAVFSVQPRVAAWRTTARERDSARRSVAAAIVADACRRLGRGSDVFGRVADDEYAVITPGADPAGLRTLMERIGRALAEAGAAMAGDAGIYGVSDLATATLSVRDMLVQAASQRPAEATPI